MTGGLSRVGTLVAAEQTASTTRWADEVDESNCFDEVELAEIFAGTARRLQRQVTPEQTWQAIADLAIEPLGFEHCGISIVPKHGRIKTPAASDELPVQVDAIQYDTGQGPCVGAIWHEDKYLVVDLRAETRWPAFSQRAVSETGVLSMLSLQLFSADDTLGALNFYSARANAFDEQTQAVAGVLAAHAAVAMSAANDHRTVEELEAALDGSRTISTAVGILMTQTNNTREGAFQLLAQASQRSNAKLHTIAELIVAGQEKDNG